MRGAYRVVVGMSLGLLAGCVTAQQQTVILSERKSAFDSPRDGKWRKGYQSRPVAVLAGRAETTAILLPRRAVLEASCYRGKSRIPVAYDVGLRRGPIAVAYHFNDAVEGLHAEGAGVAHAVRDARRVFQMGPAGPPPQQRADGLSGIDTAGQAVQATRGR